MQADVVIVGCGAAGLSCALTSLEAGKSVVMLERANEAESGGNTRWTEALLRLKSETEVTDDFVDEFTRNSGYNIQQDFIEATTREYSTWPSVVKALSFLDPEVLNAFAEGVPEVLKWLQGHGIKVVDSYYPYPLYWAMMSIYGGGLAIIETLTPIVKKKGAEVLYETTAVGLLRDDDERVVGIKAVDANHEGIKIHAASVVLACGGFEGNPQMVVQHIGPAARYMRPVARGGYYNKGEGIRMALDAGAAPAGDYADCHRQMIDARSCMQEALVNCFPMGVIVNKDAVRFMDEAPSEAWRIQEDPCRFVTEQRDGIAYLILDQKINDYPNWRTMVRSDLPPVSADSLEGLAQKLELPVAKFVSTLSAFNEACVPGPFEPSTLDGVGTEGLQPPKSNWARPIDKGPFLAYPIMSSITFTYGGLKTTANAQVVNNSGMVIPGLYAAGETVGILYGLYVGAVSVLRALTFGRIAGKHIAERSSLVN
ncbi:FAD-dependent oxidoreductase [Paraburkholderia sp. BL25I1N1]|uniref:FAD-dependent oxidoreductase n=1 Tax=Paraburkholderia sp. BL25I1N1 TaxID=1938804 RepID=UPI000D06DDAE|nr:FAD-dependent oxidoreductase [Paraburkholderia sp. BL25I1N1]